MHSWLSCIDMAPSIPCSFNRCCEAFALEATLLPHPLPPDSSLSLPTCLSQRCRTASKLRMAGLGVGMRVVEGEETSKFSCYLYSASWRLAENQCQQILWSTGAACLSLDLA